MVRRWNKPLHWCIERRVQGAFATHGDLLLQHLETLEQEAEEKDGVLQALSEHFFWVYRMPLLAAEENSAS
jgi:hypothetical protein